MKDEKQRIKCEIYRDSMQNYKKYGITAASGQQETTVRNARGLINSHQSWISHQSWR